MSTRPRIKKTVDADVVTMALDRIRHCYDLFDRVVVSFSGGKDSTVVLNLALQIAKERNRLPLEAVFWDEEAIPAETVEYCERVRATPEVAFRWMAIPVQHRNACSNGSPWWYPFDPKCEDLWCRQPPEYAETYLPGFTGQTIPECNSLLYPRDGRTVGVLLGIRADESLSRQRSVTAIEIDNYIAWEADNGYVARCKPIYDCRTEDVWLAPHRFGWDYNAAYDLMEACGVPRKDQRCAPPFGEQPMQRLYTFQICWPELWDTMCCRVPGAATAARYAKTELYAFGVGTGRSEDQSWKEFIDQKLKTFDPTTRAGVAKRIGKEIALHTKKTGGEPIPETKPHPVSGLSWKFLARVASRGDLKGRLQPGAYVKSKRAGASKK